mgnify:CR=1 FL=1
MTEEGVTFKSHIDGSKHMLSPERSMEIQKLLGSDIVMCFDECTPCPAEKDVAATSMRMSMRWAQRSRDAFGTLFAAGVASMVLFQLVVNVGMVLGVMPITGIPLPFVTHGGSSLVSMAAGLGILQSINIRQTKAAW